jgi:hypothetical protein
MVTFGRSISRPRNKRTFFASSLGLAYFSIQLLSDNIHFGRERRKNVSGVVFLANLPFEKAF